MQTRHNLPHTVTPTISQGWLASYTGMAGHGNKAGTCISPLREALEFIAIGVWQSIPTILSLGVGVSKDVVLLVAGVMSGLVVLLPDIACREN